MSRKPSKRKISFNADAAVLRDVQLLREALDCPSGRDPTQLAAHTASIHELVITQVAERKTFVHKSSDGVQTLLKGLQPAVDGQVVWNVLSILDVLAKHKHASKLSRDGSLHALLSALPAISRSSWCSDDLLLLYHSVLTRLASKEKRFAQRAQLSGLLPVSSALLKRWQGDHQNLITLLTTLKLLASRSTNAEILGKHGCVATLSKLLTRIGRKDLVLVQYCVAVLLLLLKQRSNTSRSPAQSCVKQLLSLHDYLHHADRGCRHVKLRKAILNAIKLAVGNDACLQTFHKASGLRTLYSTALEDSSATAPQLKSIATLTCAVLRRTLPKVPLPLETAKNPVKFQCPSLEQEAAIGNRTDEMVVPDSLVQQPPLRHTAEEEEEERVSSAPQAFRMIDLTVGADDAACAPHASLEHLQECADVSCMQALINGRDEIKWKQPVAFTVVPGPDPTEFDRFFPEVCTLHRASSQSGCEAANPSQQSDLDSNEKCSEGRSLSEYSWQEFPQREHNSVAQSVGCHPSGHIIIPTATALQFPDSPDTEYSPGGKAVVFTVEPQSVDSEVVNGRLGVEAAKPKSVCESVEQPVPHILGCPPARDVEPVYKRSLAVERGLTLADVERVLSPDLLVNRTVFDLDSLVHVECSQKSPSANTPGDQASTEPWHARSLSSDYLHSSPCDTTAPRQTLPLSRSSPTILNLAQPSDLSDAATLPATPPKCSIEAGPHLQFESRFESGNLRRAIQVRRNEYDLLLNSDINSDHHHQWFYFKVSNTEAGVSYRFNIINCEKPNSQFNSGMQPLLFSTTEARSRRGGWARIGSTIWYYKNNFVHEMRARGGGVASARRERSAKTVQKSFFTLSFSMKFKHSSDECYLAYHYPYTYSMLQQDMCNCAQKADDSSIFYSCLPLCTTLGGNETPLITITGREQQEGRETEEIATSTTGSEKQYVVLSARVHPGESNASWVMRGVLEFLLSKDLCAQELRRKFVFKVVPMLNPDGVINGSHRCSLSGQDLNRQWISPNYLLHPTIWHTKALLQWLVDSARQPFVFCDFHGHSRRKNVFMFGCQDPTGRGVEKLFPRLLDANAPAFSFKNCSFAVEKSKEATARVVVWRQLGIARSYTMESTYCGADQGPYKGRQITPRDLEEMGKYFCMGLLELAELPEPECDEDEIGREATLTQQPQKIAENESENSCSSASEDSSGSDSEGEEQDSSAS